MQCIIIIIIIRCIRHWCTAQCQRILFVYFPFIFFHWLISDTIKFITESDGLNEWWVCVCIWECKFYPFVFGLCDGNVTGLNNFFFVCVWTKHTNNMHLNGKPTATMATPSPAPPPSPPILSMFYYKFYKLLFNKNRANLFLVLVNSIHFLHSESRFWIYFDWLAIESIPMWYSAWRNRMRYIVLPVV